MTRPLQLALFFSLALHLQCAPSLPALAQDLPPQQAASWESHPAFAQRIDPERFDDALMRSALFYASGQARVRHGASRPARARPLEAMAQDYAERMRDKGFVAHEDPYDPGRRTPKDRAVRVGILNPMISENLATNATIEYVSGQRVYYKGVPGKFSATPEGPLLPPHTYASLAKRLVQQWLNSPGHRKNLLHPQVVELGCGVAFQWENTFPIVYAVQNFQLYEPLKAK